MVKEQQSSNPPAGPLADLNVYLVLEEFIMKKWSVL